MEMTTVYRYENDKGYGPYRGWDYTMPKDIRRMCDAHIGSHHPTWSWYDYDQDGYEVDEMPIELWECAQSKYLAGCDSREALDAWFDGWHDVLTENGFSVKEYTVPSENVIQGTSGLQVAFKP